MSIRTWVLLAVILLTAAACGGSETEDTSGVASIDDVVTAGEEAADDSVEPTTDELKSDEEAVLEFASCMRDRNIDFPDPNVDADGNVGFDIASLRSLTDLDEVELEAAFDECLFLLEGVSFGFERIFDTDFQDDLVVFSGCMRDNGFDMPDPDFGALTTTGQIFPEMLDLDDPDFEPAFEACQDFLPGIPGLSTP